MEIDDMQQSLELLNNIKNFFYNIEEIEKKLNTDLYNKEGERDDLLHEIELSKLNAIEIISAKQDEYLANNQKGKIRCGDNGIFKGMPLTEEQQQISYLAHQIYNKYNSDGKYILDMPKNKVIICQSNARTEELKSIYPTAIINPLGEWTGGTNVDTGATNRKLGSDMGDSITGGRTTWKRFIKSRCKHKYICVYESTRNRKISRNKLCNWR